MTFKITVARQPFAVEFETGSVSEAIGVLQAEGTEFAKLFDINFGGGGASEGQGDTALASGTVEAGTAEGGGKPPRKKRGADPASAVAPAPLPVPGAAPSPPAPPVDLNATNSNGIPAFLDRTGQAAPPVPSAVAPPPPLLPAAPPIAPSPPISGPVGQKIIAELESRASKSPDGGQALADWLATSGLTVKGATYGEAISCLRMIVDEKLGGVATALFG